MGTLYAGVARREINPPLGVKTAGFSAREGVVEAIESDLTTTCLVLANEDTRVAIVAVDIVGLRPDEGQRLRQLVGEAIGAPADHVLINYNHTHSGPASPNHPPEFARFRTILEAAEAKIFQRTYDAARAAANQLQPARIGADWGESHLGINRREVDEDGYVFLGEAPDKPIDPAVGVIRVDDLAGNPIAILFSYGCHTVVVGPRSPVASPDFPGAARATVEAALGGTAIFLQACGGDIMPVGGMGYEIDCSDAKNRIGAILGGEVIKVAAGIRTHVKRGERTWLRSLLGKGMTLTPWVPVEGETCTYLGSISETMQLDLVDLPSLAEAEAIRAERQRELEDAIASGEERTIQVTTRFAVWADHLVEAVKQNQRTWPMPIQALRINAITLVALGVEAFAQTGLRIKARSAHGFTNVLGYSNAIVCYLPLKEDYPAEGWSVRGRYRIPDLVFQSYLVPVALHPNSEQRVVDRALELIEELR